MKTADEITARLGNAVVALASLCLVLAIIIVLMLNERYTTDLEMAIDDIAAPPGAPPTGMNTPVSTYKPGEDGIDGQKLFRQNCAVCHALTTTPIVGPGLTGVMSRVPSKEWMHKWIKNADAMKKSGDPYATKIDKENTGTMTVFSFLSDDQVDAIIDYISVNQ